MRRVPGQLRGFTLVELLVTMGLMALLATMSIAGYYGAVRGMTDRGVKQDLVSFLRLAQQRALVDQVPTAVFCMNRFLRQGNQDLGEADRVVGMAVAVRMAGRMSYVKGNYLSDEYADLDKTYSTRRAGGNAGSTMRLWRMVKNSNVNSCFSTVRDTVEKVNLSVEELLMGNTTTNTSIWAFVKESGQGSAQWHVGDPYGTEIASLQLPHGYVFEGATVSQPGDTKGVKAFFFYPDELSNINAVGSDFNFSGLSVVAHRPGGMTKKVATINKNDLRDDNSKSTP